MKINHVKIKNFKGIKIVDVSTERNMIVISGPNGAGKSSFCDAIMTALAGKDKSITRPIREGADRASIEIELDGYVVRKYFTQSTSPALSVTPNGQMAGLKSPQAWLNEHIGNLKFDPSEFSRLEEKKQRELLMELAGLNLDEENKKIETLYNDRQFLGRELKAMYKPSEAEKHLVKGFENKEEVSVAEVSNNLVREKAIRESFLHAQAVIKKNQETIEQMKKQIAFLENESANFSKIQDTKENLVVLQETINKAEGENQKIRDAKRITEAEKVYKAKENEYETKELELKHVRDVKQQLIEAAKYPIKGLSVSDDGVLFNNIPFSQINDSQKIVIGTLIALALMPKNNPIKIIFIKLGSLLDDKALAYLEQVSLEQDAQIVVEFVGEHKGFHIIEGEIIKED